MDSTIVIKVKHAKTLRRFNARVLNNDGLEFNLDGLRNKIRGLFNFSLDADIVLTYLDEDEDKITLGDDEDLRDVVRQCLNPLRISVTLKTDNSVRTPSESENDTTIRSSPTPVQQKPFENINAAVIKFISSLPEPVCKRVIGSLPEPLGRSVTKILSDLASTGTSSALSESVQSLTDKGLASLRQLSVSTTGNAINLGGTQEAGSSNVEKSEPEHLSNEKHEKISSKFGVSIFNGIPVAITKAQSASKNQVIETNEVVKSGSSKEMQKEKAVSQGSDSIGEATRSSPLVGTHIFHPPLTLKPVGTYVPNPIAVDGPLEKAKKSPLAGSSSVPNSIPLVNNDSFKRPVMAPVSKPNNDSFKRPVMPPVMAPGMGPVSKPNIDSYRRLLMAPPVMAPPVMAPVSKPVNGVPIPSVPSFLTTKMNKKQLNTFKMPQYINPVGPAVLPSHDPIVSERNYGYTNDSGIIFHRGVCCDGCGVHPITGTRFKSRVKDDYDLCRICFSQMGIESDYIRIEHPMNYNSYNTLYVSPSQPPLLSRPKLDSRFIHDVTILDGALMAPATPFTKIWRMKNNGSIHWPKGTKMIWIGGDKMGDVISVDLEISVNGFPMDQELDVGVDFIAPDRPGRYVSYWRMLSPCGQKFGQRVWVLIQVDTSLIEVQQALRDFNLNNLPSNTPVESPRKKEDLIFPTNDNLVVGGGLTTGEGSQPVTYPTVDVFDSFPPLSSPGTFVAPPFNDDSDETIVVAPPPPPVQLPVNEVPVLQLPIAANENEKETLQVEGEVEEEDNDLEKSLLMELERMGFKENDLNKEVLRLNNYDLEKSINDLCGVSEWDPILEELHEMGFYNDEVNKKLLEKNKGSVTQVVLDLLHVD